jgi:hypothetical protein
LFAVIVLFAGRTPTTLPTALEIQDQPERTVAIEIVAV